MIKSIEQTTTVTFGKDGIATIGLNGTRGFMVMQQLIKEVEIGKPYDIVNDISELPKVVLEFKDVASIDSMVQVLERVKRMMNEPEFPTWCYAC